MRTSQAFMLVYSVAYKSSFVKLPELQEQVLRVKDIDSVPPFLLLLFPRKKELHWHENGGCAFFETDPRSKQNVGDAFYELVRTARAYYGHATKTKFGIFSKV